MSNRTNVAVFGVGRMGRVHLRHLVFGCRCNIKYLVDHKSTHESIQGLKARYRLEDATVSRPEDIANILSDKSLDAVFICTPVQGKADLVQAALKAGKNVFCEKPIDLKSEVVAKCYKTAEECGKVLQCGFDKRFDASIRKMYNQIRRGDIGQLRMIKLTARELGSHSNKEYIMSSGGIFIDSIIHEFDLMCWLAGERPNTITSYGHAHNQMFSECNDVDSAIAIMKFPSGLMGFIESFRGVNYGYDQRFEVLGSDGVLKIENPSHSLVERWDDKGQLGDRIWQDGISRYHEAYAEEVEHFLDVLQNKVVCEVPGDEVVFASKLAEYAGFVPQRQLIFYSKAQPIINLLAEGYGVPTYKITTVLSCKKYANIPETTIMLRQGGRRFDQWRWLGDFRPFFAHRLLAMGEFDIANSLNRMKTRLDEF